MKLFSKSLAINKKYDDVVKVIKSSAYCGSHTIFTGSHFAIHCARHYKGGIISSIPIKGTITQDVDTVSIILSLHSGFGFYLGSLLLLLGAVGLVYCSIFQESKWIPGLGSVLLGLLICGQYLWEGSAVLDKIEHQLLSL